MTVAPVALVYLARGVEPDHLERIAMFVRSYRLSTAGADHTLYVILKGYRDEAALSEARRSLHHLEYVPILLDDRAFDIGAYAAAARIVREDLICFVNSNSRILAGDWLRKLAAPFGREGVGLVGASGSFESLGSAYGARFPPAPNVHVRSNVFLMRRDLAAEVLGSFVITSKLDAFLAESGPDSITRKVCRSGLGVFTMGRDGRAFPPALWPSTGGFRSDDQSNLLVEDNISRDYDRMSPVHRHAALHNTWGRYADRSRMLRFPPQDAVPV